MLRACLTGLLLARVASGQTSSDPAKVLADLRQSAADLTETVKRFQTHLDSEIALHDHGYRTAAGKRVPGADSDLCAGYVDNAQSAIRKLFAARMIAARRPGYEPAALADADRIQYLIAEARHRNDDLPPDLRANLFALRARLARTDVIMESERSVRAAAARAAAKAEILEAQLAWADGAILADDAQPQENCQRATSAIELVRTLQREALAALPPDLSAPEAQFPALEKHMIVRLRRLPAGYRQEIWKFDAGAKGIRQVKRTVVMLDIDPQTGVQLPLSREVKYYRAEAGESLEEIYDEYASLTN